MSKPNFFILGAPKCGTTSVARWLSEHPQVFISPVKEPHYFNTDDNHQGTSSLERYERLFIDAQNHHKAIGEASVWYLYSEVAVSNIETYCGSPKYLVCLRNPVEMAYALHEQQVFNGIETTLDFDEAWALGESRVQGKDISGFCNEPRHLAYRTVCKLGQQMERLFAQVGTERVLPILLDDVKEDTHREYHRILQHLAIHDDARNDFEVHNSAKERRWPVLQQAVIAAGGIKRRLGVRGGLGVLRYFDERNLRTRERPAMSPATRRVLQEHFGPDIEQLANLLNRDLSHWLGMPG